jgi:DNA-binding MarR family transcriptional regulator
LSEQKTRQRKSINFRVYALASSLFKGSQQYYVTRFGVGVPEMRILSNLDSEGRMTASQLVTLTAMDKALVSRILSTLDARGLLQASAPGTDPRRRIWTLSRSGRALVTKLRPLWKEREAILQSCLSQEEHDHLEEMLERLFHASEALRQKEAAAPETERPRKSRRTAGRSAGRSAATGAARRSP